MGLCNISILRFQSEQRLDSNPGPGSFAIVGTDSPSVSQNNRRSLAPEIRGLYIL
jgi:hypothetical protein